MQTTALLVSDDLILRSEIKSVLNEAAVACQCCAVAGFDRAISGAKVECILLDIADPVKFSKAIAKVRAEKLNRYAIVLALVPEEHHALLARTSGVNFFVSKSVRLMADLKKALNSAQGLMIHEKRRYHRFPVDIRVDLLSSGQAARTRMLDLSARGACIECNGWSGFKTVRLTFVLPGMNQRLAVEAVPAWTKGKNMGVEFAAFKGDSEKTLKAWLLENETESFAASGANSLRVPNVAESNAEE
jgi:DNA-binding NarL/FixJ family response regulator